MKRKVFAIFANNYSDKCLMLVNSTDCSQAVQTSFDKTDVEDVIDSDFLQAEEVDGLAYEDDTECVIVVFDGYITSYE